MFKSILTGLGLALLMASPLPAGTLRHDDFAITYEGTVKDGDAGRLFTLLESTGIKTLYLNSPGGAAVEGYRLGYLIQDMGVRTIVKEGDVCHSACAIAFIAGATKTMDGMLGFHVAYSPEDRDTYSAGMKNGQFIGTLTAAYFFNMGYTVQLQILVTQVTDAETFLLLDVADLKAFEMKDGAYTDLIELPPNWIADRIANPLRMYLLTKGL